MKIKINLNPTRALDQLIYFLIGFFLDICYFLFCIKLLNGGGIFLSILSTFAYNYYFFKKEKVRPSFKAINWGAFSFNLLISVLLIILGIFSYSLIQNLIG